MKTANDLFDSYAETDFLPLVSNIAGNSSGHGARLGVIRAGLNKSAWTPGVVAALEDAASHGEHAQMAVLPKAGHWVHVDDLGGVLDIMRDSFR